MALYLIHCKPSGEPVGIWNDKGENHYIDPDWRIRGQAVFDSRGAKNPWSSFVEDLVQQPPHASHWLSEDNPADEVQVLDQARHEYQGLGRSPLR